MVICGDLMTGVVVPAVILKLEAELSMLELESDRGATDQMMMSEESRSIHAKQSLPFKFMLSMISHDCRPPHGHFEHRSEQRAMLSFCTRLRNWDAPSRAGVAAFMQDTTHATTEWRSSVARVISERAPFSKLSISDAGRESRVRTDLHLHLLG